MYDFMILFTAQPAHPVYPLCGAQQPVVLPRAVGSSHDRRCWEATRANWNQGIVMGCDKSTWMSKACAVHLVQAAACPCLDAEVGSGAALPQQRLH